jgi:hypothetical protein
VLWSRLLPIVFDFSTWRFVEDYLTPQVPYHKWNIVQWIHYFIICTVGALGSLFILRLRSHYASFLDNILDYSSGILFHPRQTLAEVGESHHDMELHDPILHEKYDNNKTIQLLWGRVSLSIYFLFHAKYYWKMNSRAQISLLTGRKQIQT